MPIRNAIAVWEGDLPTGKGKLQLESGAFEGNYSFSSRFEDGPGTNPEELIGAAHAGCFSMALANLLARDGFKPVEIRTNANVNLAKIGDGYQITEIGLTTEANVSDIEDSTFQKIAEEAKRNCPVSQLLTGANVELQARLIK